MRAIENNNQYSGITMPCTEEKKKITTFEGKKNLFFSKREKLEVHIEGNQRQLLGITTPVAPPVTYLQ